MSDRVSFLDVLASYSALEEELNAAVRRVLTSGHYILGPELEAFEAEFAESVGALFCVGVGNGLDALTLALRAHDIGPGDEVIVPSNTFIATWLAVTYSGATPIPVDPDPQTYNICSAGVSAALTARTRAVIPVHLYGQPADIDALRAVAEPRGIVLIEDAAQAHGARLRGRPVGSLGTTAAWSFYPGKNLGAFGDGGAVTTNDPVIAARIRQLRNYGSHQKYVHDVQGVNSRLDEIQSAVLRVKLRYLPEWNEHRGHIAAQYGAELRETSIGLPFVPDFVDPSWHLFVIRSGRRDALQSALRDRGVETLIHYPVAPHLQDAYASLGYRAGDFPVAERLQDEVLSIPIGPYLDPRGVSSVIGALTNAARMLDPS
ncbi:MAG: DegT/DnrJ/EryC1/StrS family aminotransferase [Gemmatimonadota bacterium]|nr:DegT/DnrJ/EryC1/StrS family aminotransferase [Gemmatimonadota bacterium]